MYLTLLIIHPKKKLANFIITKKKLNYTKLNFHNPEKRLHKISQSRKKPKKRQEEEVMIIT
jgi:hypothetical protein